VSLHSRGLALDERVEAQVLEPRLGVAVERELDHVADEAVELVDLVDDRACDRVVLLAGRLPAREELRVCADARERRTELVRRVCDELPLGTDRVLERGQHAVERRAESRDLVLAFGVEPHREVARLADLLGRARETPDRGKGGLRDPGTEEYRQQQCREAEHQESKAQPVQRRFLVGDRPRDLERIPLSDLGRHDAEPPVADVRGLGKRVAAERNGALARAGWKLRHLVRRQDRRAVRRKYLDVFVRGGDHAQRSPAGQLGADLRREKGDAVPERRVEA